MYKSLQPLISALAMSTSTPETLHFAQLPGMRRRIYIGIFGNFCAAHISANMQQKEQLAVHLLTSFATKSVKKAFSIK